MVSQQIPRPVRVHLAIRLLCLASAVKVMAAGDRPSSDRKQPTNGTSNSMNATLHMANDLPPHFLIVKTAPAQPVLLQPASCVGVKMPET